MENKATLSKRQQQILFLLYRHRFLHTNHFKQFFNHKDPRRIHEWLNTLIKDAYIISFYDPTTLQGQSTPRVYCLTSKARDILKHSENCDQILLKNIYREKKASKQFQEHCLFLADLYFYFNGQQLEKFHFSTKVDLVAYEYFPHPLPDAYVMTQEENQQTKRYFLDIFDPKTPWFVFKKRVGQYIIYFEENEWQANAKSAFPTVLFICMDESNGKYLKKAIRLGLEEFYGSGLNFFFTTMKDIKSGSTWERVSI